MLVKYSAVAVLFQHKCPGKKNKRKTVPEEGKLRRGQVFNVDLAFL